MLWPTVGHATPIIVMPIGMTGRTNLHLLGRLSCAFDAGTSQPGTLEQPQPSRAGLAVAHSYSDRITYAAKCRRHVIIICPFVEFDLLNPLRFLYDMLHVISESLHNE
ncbi:hypothetical protein A0H81_12533 [Grifola frondosa]|uniref:Uncharacterized protein n=1 Tax=Grifola frondosa TaxID=5627 RepID=A0A1C7LUC9_GRIFR|nr:hypothetical protein A0H81_12533 [Grifola frondosa]